MGNDQEMGRRYITFAPQTADVWFLQSCNCDEKVIERSLPYIWHQKEKYAMVLHHGLQASFFLRVH